MSYLLYYKEENERHPVTHAARCTPAEAAEAVKRLWLTFAGRKARQPAVQFTSGNRSSRAGRGSVTLNRDHLNWLLVLHELAHSLDELRALQGRRSSESRWHSK